MQEFLECVKGVSVIVIMVVVAALVTCSIIEGFYLLSRSFNISRGTVYCDGLQIYEGRLYRVDETLETRNLQSPMFSVRIRGEKNFFRIETSCFCKDYRIIGK